MTLAYLFFLPTIICLMAYIASQISESNKSDEQYEGMDRMYTGIVNELRKANNDSDLYAAYVNLLLFEVEHGETESWLVSILYEMYAIKEVELLRKTTIQTH